MEAQAILDLIGSAEAPRGYGQAFGGSKLAPPRPLDQMTVAEVMAWQAASVAAGSESGAAGRYQIIGKTLRGLVGTLGLDGSETFDKALQDRMGEALLERRGFSAWRDGRISATRFANQLAQEWAGLPLVTGPNAGRSYHHGTGSNAATISPERMMATLGGSYVPPAGAPGGDTGLGSGLPRAVTLSSRGALPQDAWVYPAPPHPTPGLPDGFDMLEPRPPAAGAGGTDAPAAGVGGAPGGAVELAFDAGGGLNPARARGFGFGAAFADAWTDSGVVRFAQAALEGAPPPVRGYDPLSAAALGEDWRQWRWFQDARSPAETEYLRRTLRSEETRRARRDATDGWVAPLLGALAQPESLASMLFIPARIGAGALAGGARVAGLVAATETASETLRQAYDPLATTAEGVLRVGSAALLTGVAGAVAGAVGAPGFRAAAGRVATEIAESAGVARFTDRLKFGEATSAVTRLPGAAFAARVPAAAQGALAWLNPASRELLVDADAIVAGWRRGDWRAELTEDLAPNATAWSEFVIRRTLARAELDLPVAGKGSDEAEALAFDRALDGFKAWRRSNRIEMKTRMAAAVMRMADSPFKRVHRAAASAEAIDLADAIAGDAAWRTMAQAAGRTIGPSVTMLAAELTRGRPSLLVEAETRLFEAFLGYADNPRLLDVAFNKSFRWKKADGTPANLTDFRRAAARAWITGERTGVEPVDGYAAEIGRFFKSYAADMAKLNLTNRPHLESRLAALTAKLDRVEKLIPDLAARIDGIEANPRGMTDRALAARDRMTALRDRLVEERALVASQLEEPLTPLRVERYFTRVWRADMAKRYPATFKALIAAQFRRVPAAWVWREVALNKRKLVWTAFDMDEAAVARRVDEFFADMTGVRDVEALYRPGSTPAFARMRVLDFDNKDLIDVPVHPDEGGGVADFIETDAQVIANHYAQRMGPAIADAQRFDFGAGADAGFEEALAGTLEAEAAAYKGTDPAGHLGALERDLRFLRDAALNRVMTDPARLDNRVVAGLRNVGHLAYMGLAGISSVTELGKVVMAHGVAETAAGAFRLFDDQLRLGRLGAEELRAAGGLGDVSLSLAASRLAEQGTDAMHVTAMERWLRAGVNKFFVWNLLGPLTVGLRTLDGSIRQSQLVKAAIDVATGTPAAAEARGFLAQHGISPAMARRIARQRDLGNVDRHPVDGFYLAATDRWTDDHAVRAFRAALGQGSENTILLATVADKPAMMGGALHFRSTPVVDRAAKALGLTRVGAYWRVQSGLIGLPFSYWSFGIATMNKTLAPLLNAPSASMAAGIAVMLGLGYVSGQARFNLAGQHFAWDSMSLADKLVHVLDRSGVAGILPDVMFKAQALSIAATGVNPTPFAPRGGVEPGLGRALLDPLGAPTAIARSLVAGGFGVVAGREGAANELSWAMPGRNYPPTRWLYEGLVDALEPAP